MKKNVLNKPSYSALVLLVSGIICKCLGAFFRLPLTNLLGIEGIGIFQLIMSLYSFALVLTSGGLATALSKLISSARARGQTNKIGHYLKYALLFSAGTGILIGVLFVLFGKNIALLQGIDEGKSYFLFVFLLPLGALLAGFRGFFQGYANMLPTAASQILEQVFKFAFGIFFASLFSKFGITHGVFGAFLGIAISEVVAVVFLFVVFVSQKKKFGRLKDLQELRFARREFFSANLPLTISASILPLVNALEGLFIIPRLSLAGLSSGLATKLFGLQSGVVGAILNFPLIISMAVTTALLPNISFLISKGTGGKQMIERGLKTLLFLVLPTTFGVVAISQPIFELVYDDLSGQILRVAFSLACYGGFSIVFTALMQYFVMLLQANGQFRFVLLATLVSGICKVNISFFLSSVQQINIYAIVLGNLAQTAIVCLMSLSRLKKILPLSLSFGEVFSLVFSTVSMFAVVYTFISCNYFSPVANILVGVMLGVVVYAVFSLPLLIKILPKKKQVKRKIDV